MLASTGGWCSLRKRSARRTNGGGSTVANGSMSTTCARYATDMT